MSGLDGVLKQISIETTCMATSSGRRCDGDPIHIYKARIARTEPEEIRTVVIGGLIECQQEGVEISNAACQERLAYKMR